MMGRFSSAVVWKVDPRGPEESTGGTWESMAKASIRMERREWARETLRVLSSQGLVTR